MSGDPLPEAAGKAVAGQLSAIGRAIAAGQSGQEVKSPPALPTVEDLADKLELLTADFGRWTEYKGASAEYIREFKTEIEWHRNTRAAVVICCAVLVFALFVLLLLATFSAKELFGADQAHSLTGLIVGCIGGMVVISIAALRGAFATMKDRNEGLPMPEHLKEVVDLGAKIFK